ncbi:MAG TPA: hypothetical protein VNK43_06665 [Gemmatimonadales bacterium]|nr:hypothetical protein [Gemmatimonadales bacterium]
MPRLRKPPRRQRIARLGFRVILAAWAAATIGMLTHQLLAGAAEPAPAWFIAAGLLVVALGGLLVLFRHEMREIFEERTEWGLPHSWSMRPSLFVGLGAILVVVGLYLVIDALVRAGALGGTR